MMTSLMKLQQMIRKTRKNRQDAKRTTLHVFAEGLFLYGLKLGHFLAPVSFPTKDSIPNKNGAFSTFNLTRNKNCDIL